MPLLIGKREQGLLQRPRVAFSVGDIGHITTRQQSTSWAE